MFQRSQLFILALRKALLFSNGAEVEFFHFGSGPGRFSEKGQAGFDGRIVSEAFDPDSATQAFPSIFGFQVLQDGHQFDTVQGIVGLVFFRLLHGVKVGLKTLSPEAIIK